MRMKKGWVVAPLLALCAGRVLAAPELHGALAADEVAGIVALADATDAEWNARDAAGLAALYTDGATLMMVDRKQHIDGRAAVADYFTRSFAAIPAALRHRTVVDRLTVLADDLVMADTSVALTRVGADGQNEPVRDFATLTLVRREADGWRLEVVRAHALAPPPPVSPRPGAPAAPAR